MLRSSCMDIVTGKIGVRVFVAFHYEVSVGFVDNQSEKHQVDLQNY